jgi:6-pyruvoyltetrahydropterin/6-carboxytetrahydropterin synthase
MMRIADFSRRYHFSASHRLYVDHFSEEQNDATFGKCNNPHGHGHNYTLEITVRGPVATDTGMVVNMVDLDRVIEERVVSRFDMQNLNCDPDFKGVVPSTENLCRAAWRLLKDTSFGTAKLERMRIEETTNNFFEFTGENAGEEA